MILVVIIFIFQEITQNPVEVLPNNAVLVGIISQKFCKKKGELAYC